MSGLAGSSTLHVQGRCPSCKEESLVLDGDHHVVCDTPGCPDQTAAAALLETAGSSP